MKTKSILLVEDDIIAQRIERDILEGLGYTVEIVSDGTRALEKIKAHDYQYVFIDISLPDMDGFTLAETILQQVKNNPPQLIALSIHADELHRQCAKDSGMKQFVRKPLTTAICHELFKNRTTA